ncbi:MAG: isopentenyl-diphosphate Delta-isomerase [Sphingobacteriales bacterium]|nr:MAG: isopentenyl-diphosphate Delta-isomerase [Sphingobacteriales bacterium]
MNYVLEVNEADEVIGKQEKLYAHQQGILHRAFSIFIFNSQGELLLQQRADGKYHCGGLWTNTCCSHPLPNEDTLAAAHRRLMEEMGFDCELNFVQKFRYKAIMDNSLVENELDHIYKGVYNGEICPNPEEVQAIKYVSWEELQADLQQNPEQYTPWLKLICASVAI